MTTLSRQFAFRAEEIIQDDSGEFLYVDDLEDWIKSRLSADQSAEQILEELLEIVA